MDAQLENCIKSKSYAELTSAESAALSIYCTNEDEFNLLKEIYNSTDLQDDVDAKPNQSVKMKLDQLFEENYAATLDSRSAKKTKRFYQKPLYYLAAASVVLAVSLLFIDFNSTQITQVKTGRTIPVKKEKVKEIKAIVPEDKTLLAKNIIPKPTPRVLKNEKLLVLTADIEEVIAYEDVNEITSFSFQYDNKGTYDDDVVADFDSEITKERADRNSSPLLEIPEMLDVLFTAY
jgi:hypothetical protein